MCGCGVWDFRGPEHPQAPSALCTPPAHIWAPGSHGGRGLLVTGQDLGWGQLLAPKEAMEVGPGSVSLGGLRLSPHAGRAGHSARGLVPGDGVVQWLSRGAGGDQSGCNCQLETRGCRLECVATTPSLQHLPPPPWPTTTHSTTLGLGSGTRRQPALGDREHLQQSRHPFSSQSALHRAL